MGWTVTECARRLGTPREHLSRLLNGRIGISPAMAIALERIGWSNARFWLLAIGNQVISLLRSIYRRACVDHAPHRPPRQT